MTRLPHGRVTLLFTDIEGSTRLLQELGSGYARLLDEHRRALRSAFARHHGVEVDTQGDAFFVAFARPDDAVAAAVEAQRALSSGPVHVRMGVHVGEPAVVGDGYVGLDVHRAARICASAHGGQVLLSGETVAAGRIDEQWGLLDLGEHRLKDLPSAERLVQLVIDGLPSEFPPPKTLERPTNLPAPTSPLIGRGGELSELHDLVRQGHARAITLTGPGGVGKTRLALEIARENLTRFGSGVFVVELAAVLDPTEVAASIGRVLNVKEEPRRPIVETLQEWLRYREILLVLDNFEHVLAAAPVVAQLLAEAPGLTVVVTSRSPLRLTREHVYEVAPLPIGDGVALFAERARAIDARFDLTSETAGAVADICERLDGLPLAIELAAARTRTLPPRALVERLDRRLDILGAGARDAPARQQTLRATIDWSYALLAPEQQSLFQRTAVFLDGFSLDGVEFVASGLVVDVLDGMEALVDASLVRHDGGRSEARFRILETIREYGLERLAESGDEADVRRRHALFVVDLVEAAEPNIRGRRQDLWVERVEQERGNVASALAWAEATRGEADLALRLVGAFVWFWIVHGDFREAQEAVERLLGRADARHATLARAKLLAAKALLHAFYWDTARAEPPAQEALEVARGIGAEWPQALALNVLGTVARVQGDHELARSRYQAALALDSSLEDRWPTALAYLNLGIQAYQLGEDDHAAELLEQGIALSRDGGDRFFAAFTFSLLARLEQRRGELRRAAALHHEALAVCQPLGSRWATALCLEGQAELEELTGSHERAARLLGAEGAVRAAANLELWPWVAPTHDQTVMRLRTALGEAAFSAALAEGARLTREEALVLALDTARSTSEAA